MRVPRGDPVRAELAVAKLPAGRRSCFALGVSSAVYAAVVAAIAALIGVLIGRTLDTRNEGKRWLRDVRLARTESGLRHMDTMRDYATRLALPNNKRSLEEKAVDHHRFGEEQRLVLQECSALRLTGTKELQTAADSLAKFISGTLRSWTLQALRAAERDSPFDPEDITLVRMSELIGDFETAARKSLRGDQLRLQR